jgi:predicted PurR-regulated permease PerM
MAIREVDEKESGLIDKTDHSHPPPNIQELSRFIKGPLNVRSFPIVAIFVLMIFYTLYFARIFFLPIVLAILLSFLLSPIVRGLKRLWIPEYVGAALVMLFVLGILGVGIYYLIDPATQWMATVPKSISRIEQKVRLFRKPVEQVTKTAERVEKITTVTPQGTPQVAVRGETLVDRVFTSAWQVLAGALVVIILLYFLLASGDLFLRKLVKVMPTFENKKLAVEIASRIEDHISKYLMTVTMINLALGTAVGTGLGLLGMPNPVLWGVMVALLNFIPYLGATVGISIVTIVAFLTFHNTGHALAVPGIYLGLAVLEGNFLTPIILGKRLTLNPVIIFICIIFWGWLWGIVGAFLAVPMVAVFKILCDHVEPLAAIGEFLGD